MTEERIDTDAVAAHLRSELGVDVTDVEVLSNGLNLNLVVSSRAGRSYVVRQPNVLRHTELFLALRDEYGLLERLQDTPVPAPEPVLFCEDDSILGGPFAVLTYRDGAVVGMGSNLPERFQTPGARRRLAHLLIDTLAEVHAVGPDRVGDVCDRVSPAEQLAHERERLDTARDVTGHEVPALDRVGAWLEESTPESETTLVHGDYRPGNVLFAGDQEPTMGGVVDWEVAMLGDPVGELGYLLLRWRDEGDPTPSVDAIAARHPDADDALTTLRRRNETGLAPFSAAPGSPSRRELIDRYERQTGRSVDHWRYHLAHAAFSLATVWADLHRGQVEDGADSQWEPHIEYMAALAELVVNGEFPA
jgi:Predicted aminoglycoside phosphotransferase